MHLIGIIKRDPLLGGSNLMQISVVILKDLPLFLVHCFRVGVIFHEPWVISPSWSRFWLQYMVWRYFVGNHPGIKQLPRILVQDGQSSEEWPNEQGMHAKGKTKAYTPTLKINKSNKFGLWVYIHCFTCEILRERKKERTKEKLVHWRPNRERS